MNFETSYLRRMGTFNRGYFNSCLKDLERAKTANELADLLKGCLIKE